MTQKSLIAPVAQCAGNTEHDQAQAMAIQARIQDEIREPHVDCAIYSG